MYLIVNGELVDLTGTGSMVLRNFSDRRRPLRVNYQVRPVPLTIDLDEAGNPRLNFKPFWRVVRRGDVDDLQRYLSIS